MLPLRRTDASRAVGQRPRFRPRLLSLENRVVPAGFSFWDGGGDGTSWFDAANWSDDLLPQSGADVYLFAGPSIRFDGDVVELRSLFIGANTELVVAAGSVTVAEELEVGSLTIESGAEFTLGVEGSPFFRSTVTDDLVNRGTFRLSGSAEFDFGEGFIVGQSLDVGGSFENVGLFIWDGDAEVRLGFDGGKFHNTGTALLLSDSRVSGFDEDSYGSYGEPSQFPVSTVSDLSTPLDGYLVLNEGLLVKRGSDGESRFDQFASFENRGILAIESGTLFLFGDLVQTAGRTTLGTADGNVGAISLLSPSESPGGFFLFGGLLTGNGTISGDLFNDGGTVAPGFSPGVIAVLGDYVQTANGRLRMEIAGPDLTDLLAVSGTANLAGALDLVSASDFLPPLGSRFVLVSAEVIDGAFDTVTGVDIPPNMFDPFVDPTEAGVVVIASPPEPPPEEPPPTQPLPEEPLPVQMAPVEMPTVAETPTNAGTGFVLIPTAATGAGEPGIVEDPVREDAFFWMLLPDGDAAAALRRIARRNEPFEYGTAYRVSGDAGVPGEIAGTIWTDFDGDGKQSPDEPYRAGQIVFLDADDDGRRGEGEPWTTTDRGGNYRFRDLWPGRYTVRLELGPKSRQTLPREPLRTVTLTAEMRAADDADFAVNDRKLKQPIRPTPVSRPKGEDSPLPPGMGALAMLGLRPPRRRDRRRWSA